MLNVDVQVVLLNSGMSGVLFEFHVNYLET